ncbi:MAG: hypothetical protein GEV11_09150, partial [Streptosporangiales bacterium]|nr:hypothetical protein [Streptosporangiales bacterium]
MRELPVETGDRVREPGESRHADDFRLAGPGGVDILPASQVELPEFHLDRRTHDDSDTPRQSLHRFEPERAGLPETTLEEAPGYI